MEYPGYVRKFTDETTTANILCNSMVSTPKAKYMVIDIENFYLSKPLTRYYYLHISITLIPKIIIQQYNLLPLVRKGFIYFYICKIMYGLTQVD